MVGVTDPAVARMGGFGQVWRLMAQLNETIEMFFGPDLKQKKSRHSITVIISIVFLISHELLNMLFRKASKCFHASCYIQNQNLRPVFLWPAKCRIRWPKMLTVLWQKYNLTSGLLIYNVGIWDVRAHQSLWLRKARQRNKRWSAAKWRNSKMRWRYILRKCIPPIIGWKKHFSGCTSV